jgi:DNA-binding response OmpR family regulator
MTSTRQLKALVVDDDFPLGQMIAEHLRRKGFEPSTVGEGTAAIRFAREHRPDLIVLDLMLPDIDGFTVCETLKLERETNLIPIVMATVLREREDMIHGWQVGANRYLTKPFTLEQLSQAVAEALAWRNEMEKGGSDGEICFEFQSDVKFLEDLNQLMAVLFLQSPLSARQIHHLTTALREIGTNAIEWGHRNQIDRIVQMTYRIDKEKVTLVVRDSGPGFNPEKLPHAASSEDPTRHLMVREALGLREGGFGLMIAKGLVDELTYNEKGNEARLVKYFETADEKPVPQESR